MVGGKGKSLAEIFVAPVSEFEESGCRIIAQDDLEVGVFLVGGVFHAFENECPHQGGPVCQGRLFCQVEEILDEDLSSLGERFLEEQVRIVCPWHGYEFDVKTGKHPADERIRLRKFDVEVRNEEVFVIV